MLASVLKKHWFIALLAAAVVLALQVPAPGVWVEARTGTKPFIVVLLFMTSLTFDASELLAGLKAPKPLLLSLLGTYAILPALLYAAAQALGLGSDLGVGLLALAAAPTTLASGVIWTRLAGGPAPLAVVLTVASNVGNVLLGPLVLKVAAGGTLARPFGKIVLDLALIVLLPIVLGQAGRRLLRRWVDGWVRAIGVLSRCLICCVIVVAVSGASERAGQEASALRVLGLVGLCAAAHGVVVGCMEGCGRLLGLPLPQRIATVFIGGRRRCRWGSRSWTRAFRPRNWARSRW
ncbi:MAG: bile acid:sodium symporter [Planctomycetota bacterium]|nr:bile acid:sodium symporter [Planctomycetota bacterium]